MGLTQSIVRWSGAADLGAVLDYGTDIGGCIAAGIEERDCESVLK